VKTVLVAIEEFSKTSAEPLNLLREAGFTVLMNDTGYPLDYEKHRELYGQAQFVIAGLEPYPAPFFSRFPSVRVISRVGVGVDVIDIPTAIQRNVKIMITSDQPSVSVAELCLGNMIALLRGTFEMSEQLKRRQWHRIQGRDLRGSVVGIVGLGSIGKEVARRVHAFGARIIAHGRTWDDAFAHKFDISRKTIEEIFLEAAVITVHLPHTKETERIINRKLIYSVQPGTILLNTSRAGVIDNQALADAIRERKVDGAAVDVFEEARDPHPYSEIDRVILTPHIGSHTYETRRMMEITAVKNIIAYASLAASNSAAASYELQTYIDKHSVN
jgi:D-3-phosphoglycerate dehydrogenase